MNPSPEGARYETVPGHPMEKPVPALVPTIEIEKDTSKEAVDAAALFSGEKKWYAYRGEVRGIVEPFYVQVLGLKEIDRDKNNLQLGDNPPQVIDEAEIRELLTNEHVNEDTIINRESIRKTLATLDDLRAREALDEISRTSIEN